MLKTTQISRPVKIRGEVDEIYMYYYC